MSKASVQFVEMARQARQPEPVKFKRTFAMYCENCGTIKQHRFSTNAEWERYICTVCGNTQEFRVR